MCRVATILELRRRSAAGIYAVCYRRGRPCRVERLRDGLIVESPTPSQRRDAPSHPAPCVELAAGGGLATVHHMNLGLVAGYLSLDGVYRLPSGDVAAVYGADVVGLGQPPCKEGSAALD
jgi:hypothetical protein